MLFSLKRPCSNCPFRNDVYSQKGWLGLSRAVSIADGLTVRQGSFTCHKTLKAPEIEQEHCAGALILLEKMNEPNQLMRIAERIRSYDKEGLDMDSPIFDSMEQFVSWHDFSLDLDLEEDL